MFGGLGTILLIVVMRIVSSRAWRQGVGLGLLPRLGIPAISLVIALVSLRRGGGQVLESSAGLVVLVAAAVTAAAAVVRAKTLEYSMGPESKMHPGGVTIRAGRRSLTADIVATLVSAALVFLVVAPPAGLSAAAGSWTLTLVVGDIVLAVLLVVRGRAAELVR